MSLDENLQRVRARLQELQALLVSTSSGTEIIGLSRELAEITPVVEKIDALQNLQDQIDDALLLAAQSADDPEFQTVATQEADLLKRRLPLLTNELEELLLPAEEADAKNAILEIRPGTGGEEASLFAADIYAMYQKFAALRGWQFEALGISETPMGGYREAIASVSGRSVFARLKFESGTHRVQRVPVTESGGRIHTSAVTVAVLPEAQEVDIALDRKDLRFDYFRASGPGGQKVNKTDSAVRITHLPSGIVVSQQDEKSQHKNKAKAMRILRTRLYEQERGRLVDERAADRRGQIGSGDRSERIRTYNFPQGRVTDHRINLTLHKIDKVLNGEALDEIIDALTTEEQAARLAALP